MRYNNFCQSIGYGTHNTISKPSSSSFRYVQIPDKMLLQDPSVDNMIQHTYPNIDAPIPTFQNTAILTPLNEDVRLINAKALEKMQGRTHVSTSIDYVQEDEAQEDIDEEWLWEQNVASLPLHELKLKKHVIFLIF